MTLSPLTPSCPKWKHRAFHKNPGPLISTPPEEQILGAGWPTWTLQDNTEIGTRWFSVWESQIRPGSFNLGTRRHPPFSWVMKPYLISTWDLWFVSFDGDAFRSDPLALELKLCISERLSSGWCHHVIFPAISCQDVRNFRGTDLITCLLYW